MLFIQKIRYRNILSAGNQFTEINFTEEKTTLIKGNSGQGKSLIVTALIFALYGKSNRGTTKKQLINSVNKKDCLVEVEFSSDGKLFKVRRGITPNIFEIFVNNKLQEQLSAVKDQQKYLEQNILKMSYKTFMQIVVLGSNNYTPFMQLSSTDRRDLVEELLDIKIFSSMNILIKDKIKNLDKKKKELELQQNSIDDKIEMQIGFIEKITKSGNELVKVKKLKILDFENQKQDIIEENSILLKDLNTLQTQLSQISFSEKKMQQLLELKGKLSNKKSLMQNEYTFFENNFSCPTCSQHIDEDFRKTKLKDINSEVFLLDEGYSELIKTLNYEENQVNKVKEITNSISNINSNILTNQNKVESIESHILNLSSEIKDIENKIKNQNDENELLNTLKKDKIKIQNLITKCNEALNYFEFSNLLMKDGGVKSKIIKRYIPIINTQINKYLQLMDLYLNFTLDEEFKESINTPIHDGFTYSSFSEGEKQRINLSAILSWRDIAKMKNSINCNLIFFDETLDSSLDSYGIDDFLKIINYVVKDSNVFVISHREGFDDKFNRVLEVKKVNSFSKIIA
jgi:DNA repair exonuclease SbcCD ATPase subunit